MSKLRMAPALLALALLLAACGGGDDGGTASNTTGGASATGGATVELKDLKFNPEKLSIKTGETVTWVWKENVLHNVQGDGFKSDNMSNGTYEQTFTKAGTFDYQCTLHSGMKGSVEVT